MSFDGWDIKVFCLGIEEGHCWGVDAGKERTTGGRVPIDSVYLCHFDVWFRM